MTFSVEETMHEILRKSIMDFLLVIVIIFVTQTVFFIVYSYFVSGDAFLVLRNFYAMTYNWRL